MDANPLVSHFGGLLSVVIVALVALSISKIGVCNATTAIIVGQVGVAVLIDHLGLLAYSGSLESLASTGTCFIASGAKLLFR
jgi:transporter family-2 protein